MRLTLKNYLRRAPWFVMLAGLTFPAYVSADFVLTAPPRESVEAGEKTYGALATHLSKVLGKKVVYEHPRDWKNYEKQMQAGKYDIVFDGPHFAAWRIASRNSHPLVKLPGNLNFMLVVRDDQFEVQEVRDLVGKQVCTLPPPNLGAMTLYSMYPNPMRQPEFVLLKGGFKNIGQQLGNGKCKAGILRTSFYKKKLPEEIRKQLRVLETSEPLTNQGITVSDRLSARQRERVLQALTSSKVPAAGPLFERFSLKAQSFIPATQQDYAGHNLLRDNMIFGW